MVFPVFHKAPTAPHGAEMRAVFWEETNET